MQMLSCGKSHFVNISSDELIPRSQRFHAFFTKWVFNEFVHFSNVSFYLCCF